MEVGGRESERDIDEAGLERHAMLLALKMEERATKQEMQVASGNWKRHRRKREERPLLTL